MENSESSLSELPNLSDRPAMRGGGTLGEITQAMKQDREETGLAKTVRNYVTEMAKRVTGRGERVLIMGEKTEYKIVNFEYTPRELARPGFEGVVAMLVDTGREKRLGFILNRKNDVTNVIGTTLAFSEGDTYDISLSGSDESNKIYTIDSVSNPVDFAEADGKRNRDRYEMVRGVAENDLVSVDHRDTLHIDPTGEQNGGIKVTALKLEDLQRDTLSPLLPKRERGKNPAYEAIKSLAPRLYKRVV